jgi:hypothetical protein
VIIGAYHGLSFFFFEFRRKLDLQTKKIKVVSSQHEIQWGSKVPGSKFQVFWFISGEFSNFELDLMLFALCEFLLVTGFLD